MHINFSPEDLWPKRPLVYEARSERGRSLCFAVKEDGTMPALVDLKNISDGKELKRLNSMFDLMARDGPTGMNRRMFIAFIGDDGRDKMAEFRCGDSEGVRVLCFERPNKEILLASAFRKPPQNETPPHEKRRAREVLKSHLTRVARESGPERR